MAAGYISSAPPSTTSTDTVVEAPPASEDFRSIFQNGASGPEPVTRVSTTRRYVFSLLPAVAPT
jgi:hypothetical protein